MNAQEGLEQLRALNEQQRENINRLKLVVAKIAVEWAPVVHARWMMSTNGYGICSNCNRGDHIDPIATHCRYCGAKMDGDPA